MIVPEAPKPNSIRPAAAVALFDSGGNILLLRRKDNDKWTLPGGTLDFGESLTYCAIREVREETGLQIRITGLIGTYTDPHILIAYSDGEVRQEFTFVYAAEIGSGEFEN
jgi:8-oxo-dGTP diphosphatase